MWLFKNRKSNMCCFDISITRGDGILFKIIERKKMISQGTQDWVLRFLQQSGQKAALIHIKHIRALLLGARGELRIILYCHTIQKIYEQLVNDILSLYFKNNISSSFSCLLIVTTLILLINNGSATNEIYAWSEHNKWSGIADTRQPAYRGHCDCVNFPWSIWF